MEGHSLIEFTAISFTPPEPEATDWWFFYSPRAVEYALGPSALRTSGGVPQVKMAALGAGTARALRVCANVSTPDFMGAGSPEEVAKAFGEMAAGQTVFFPRAEQSRRTVQRLLADQITVFDAVCYTNRPQPAKEPIPADVYVFTSPLNVAAYLDHQPLAAGARVIAIGPSTGAALAQRGFNYDVAETPGEESVVDRLRDMEK